MLPYYECFGKYDLPEKLAKELFDENANPLQRIDKLNKINIFVGPNNSGKSLLMRELLKTKSKSYYSDDRWAEIKDLLQIFPRIQERIRKQSGFNDFLILGDYTEGNLMDLAVLMQFYTQFAEYKPDYVVQAVEQSLKTAFDRDFSYQTNRRYYFIQTNKVKTDFGHGNQEMLKKILECLNELKGEVIQVRKGLLTLTVQKPESARKMYLPAVRSLKPFSDPLQLDASPRKDYQFPNEVEVFSGQSFANAVSNHKNNFSDYRAKIEEYETFLSQAFFQDRKIVLTYHGEFKILLIKVGNEHDRPIYELGDGLQMIITLTWPFFMYESGTISIEEPELFIHPGLQKEYMHFLITHGRTNQFQIFLTTHSNHILDSINAADCVSVFSIRKKDKGVTVGDDGDQIPDFVIENVADGNENILRLLGVTSTSVYLSNCVIWVEGITDRIYLQRYIEIYLKRLDLHNRFKVFGKFKEGINYCFSLTGGDAIVHFDFDETAEYEKSYSKIIVRRFCSKSFVVVDNDSNKNQERKEAMKRILGDRLVILPVPEVENLLSPEVINSVVTTWPTVEKALETRSLIPVSVADLEKKKIGELIDGTILMNFNKVRKFGAGNGSLIPGLKYDFCIRAVDYVSTENISEHATKLVEQILDFIISMNQRSYRAS